MTAAPEDVPEVDPPFGVRAYAAGDATVVALEGDLDLLYATHAAEALRTAQADAGTVVLDLRALRFIDSSGLRVVLEAHRRAAEAAGGSELHVAPGEGEVRRVFEVSGVGGLLTLVEAPPFETDP